MKDFEFDLQLFAGKPDTDEEDVVEDDNPELDAEDDDEEDPEDTEDTDPEEDGDKKPPAKAAGKAKAVDFTPEQREHVENIVKDRLERYDTKLDREFSREAGVEVSRDEVMQAADLWGFLKLNPQISEAVQRVIDAQVAKGNVVQQNKRDDDKTIDLSRREAILDMKADSPYFAKNSKKILEWAEDEGFEITDDKSLRRAVLAYKGANGRLDKATEEHKKKQGSPRDKARSQSRVASTKGSGTPKSKTDFTKMSDADVLAASGQKLFTDD